MHNAMHRRVLFGLFARARARATELWFDKSRSALTTVAEVKPRLPLTRRPLRYDSALHTARAAEFHDTRMEEIRALA